MLSASSRLSSRLTGFKQSSTTRFMSSATSIPAKSRKTASYLLIGDEILSGTVKDTNCPFLAKYVRNRGIDLLRIEVIPDKVCHLTLRPSPTQISVLSRFISNAFFTLISLMLLLILSTAQDLHPLM